MNDTLRQSCERFVEENFNLQRKLIERFGLANPGNKLPHLHCFTPPYVTLASFSYAILRAFGTQKVKNKMFAVMDPNGIHAVKSSLEEYQWVCFLETKYSDILHGFNSKARLPRFCNSILDAISYEAKTLFYYHGVSEVYLACFLLKKFILKNFSVWCMGICSEKGSNVQL